MKWPFRRHEQAGRGSQDDATDQLLSWAERTLAAKGARLRYEARFLGPLDSPMDVSDTAADPGDWRSRMQDPSEGVWGRAYTEVAEEPDGDGVRAEPGTTVVVVTTPSAEASEGEAHIFANAQEAKLFVERLIDDGFDRERIKTIRGGPAHFALSFRAVVDFD